ncbi:MAG: hypothetical protein O2807_14195 [bacterium]|nr:hypothetical protein [bacterium]
MANQKVASGPAAAAALTACAAVFLIGVLTVVVHASKAVGGMLNWWNPAGPLTGKTGLPIILWIVGWAVLHSAWKEKEVDFGKIWKISLVLLALGLLGVFPPFFEAF